MADKDFKVKTGIDLPSPLPASEGGTGQTSLTNAFNALLPAQAGNANKVLQTDGTNTTWVTLPNGYTRGGTGARPGSPSPGDLFYNTDTNYFESYTANGWFPIAATPSAPTGVTAINQPTGRAYNDGQMSISFTPNSNGGAPSSFIVTPSPSTSPATFTGSSSPILVTGLASNTQYAYTVAATSPYGTSSQSSASTGVTATTVPQAPTAGTPIVVAGSNYGSTTSLDVPVTANSTGGSAITSYTVTSSPGGFTATGATSPLRVSGLTGGTSYTFTATATNANGTSAASSASVAQNAVTKPDAPVLGTITATNTTTVSIPFTINNGGQAPTSFTVTSNPSISLSTSSTSSPLSVTGTFNGGTSYTFTVTATNSAGTSNASSASNSVTPNPTYSLSQTYNTSGTFTMPSGKTKVAVYAFSGAQPGSSGSGSSGGSGGSGSRGAAFSEYTASPGTNFNVTIGSSGGTTNFGGLLEVSPSTTNNNVANTVSAAGGGGGGATSNGSAGSSLTLNQAGLTTYNTGGGGAGGGNGCSWNSGMGNLASVRQYGTGCSGNAGGSSFTAGGGGGSGGWGGYLYSGTYYANAGGTGSSGTSLNGGGGGGGGGSAQSAGQASAGSGGNGSPGIIYVYTA